MKGNLILLGATLALIGIIYAFMGSLEALWDLTVTGQNIVAPKKEVVEGAGEETQPLTGIGAKFAPHLLIMGSDGNPHGVDSAKLAKVKYWAFYYSASWCPPCRAFTPELVSFYNGFKPSHPNFELIFVSDDRSDGDMMSYMKGDSMPWPAVWYAEIRDSQLGARKYCGPGIPCLVLVDAEGAVLSDSFRGSQYLGPEHVLNDIREIVK